MRGKEEEMLYRGGRENVKLCKKKNFSIHITFEDFIGNIIDCTLLVLTEVGIFNIASLADI